MRRLIATVSPCLLAAVLAVFTAGLSLPAAAFANACLPKHCYAIDNWEEAGTAGLSVSMKTDYAYVPGETDRMQNEAWAAFSNGGWVEAGGTTGYIGVGHPTHQPGYVYFEAASANGSLEPPNFSESDQTNGPGGNTWWGIDIHYAPSFNPAGWYISQAGTRLAIYPNLPAWAYVLQGGLEETNENIVNWGAGANAAWWDGHTGELHTTGWGISPYTRGNTCFYMPSQTNFDFKAGAPPCTGPYARTGAATKLPRRTSKRGLVVGSPSETAPEGVAPAPDEGAVTTGPELTAQAIQGGAREIAERWATGAVTAQESVATSVRKAVEAAPVKSVLPSTDTTQAQSAYFSSDAYEEVFRGNFTLSDAPVPAGAETPSGTILSLVIDAHTGQVINTSVSSTKPTVAKLRTLGAVTTVG